MGFSVRTAWLHAMSEDTEWTDYLSHDHLDLVDDWRLPGEVLRRRLMDVVRAEAMAVATSAGVASARSSGS